MLVFHCILEYVPLRPFKDMEKYLKLILSLFLSTPQNFILQNILIYILNIKKKKEELL